MAVYRPVVARVGQGAMLRIARPLAIALALGAAVPTTARAATAASPGGIGAIAAAVEPDGEMTDVERAKDGLFYVDVLINGQSIRFLVDTGANMVVLTGADAARLGIQARVNPFGPQMSTAGGQAPMAWARLDHVQLAGREMRDLKAAVVPSGLPVSLMGQNMLSRLGSVTIEGDRLRLR